MIPYDYFQATLKNLEEQNNNLKELAGNQPELIIEAIQDSITRRFKFCWHALWKTLRRYLIEEVHLQDVPNAPKLIIQVADKHNLLSPPVEKWLQYSHTRLMVYDCCEEEKMEDILAIMDDFVADAIGLYQTMRGKSWE